MFRSRSPLVMLALALVLTLCGTGLRSVTTAAQDKVELRVWDQFTDAGESDIADAIYKGFTEQNPNVTITREAIDTDQMRQTVNTAIASGTGPDVIFYDAGPGYAGVLADAGLLQPLDEMATQYGWKERIVKSAQEGTTIDGKLYGLPLQVDLIGMYYNKTLLDKEGLQVPKTLDELITFCGQAKDKGYVPMAFSNNPGWQAFHQFSMTSNDMIGPAAMRQLLFDHTGSWNTPEMVTAIKSFFVDLQKAGCFSSDVNALTYDDGGDLFYSGQALLSSTGSWFVNNIEENMPDSEVGFVPFPSITGAKGTYWVSGVGSAYYISAKSPHQKEAAQLLDYLFSPETAKRWIQEARFFVPMEIDTADLEVTPLFKTILDTLQSAAAGKIELGYNVDVLAPPQFNDAMQNGFQAILSGDKTPEQEAADLQAAWEAGMKGATGTPQA